MFLQHLGDILLPDSGRPNVRPSGFGGLVFGLFLGQCRADKLFSLNTALHGELRLLERVALRRPPTLEDVLLNDFENGLLSLVSFGVFVQLGDRVVLTHIDQRRQRELRTHGRARQSDGCVGE